MSAAVVMLPTAAPRKVRQPWTRARLAARAQLPQFPRNHHRTPDEREALKRAAIIRQINPSAALVISLALFRLLDEGEQLATIGLCAAGGRLVPEVVQAIEILEAQRKGHTYGDNATLEWAFDQLEQEEAE